MSDAASSHIQDIGQRWMKCEVSFHIIYDNINQYHKSWCPSIASQNSLESGTAAMLIMYPIAHPDAFDAYEYKKWWCQIRWIGCNLGKDLGWHWLQASRGCLYCQHPLHTAEACTGPESLQEWLRYFLKEVCKVSPANPKGWGNPITDVREWWGYYLRESSDCPWHYGLSAENKSRGTYWSDDSHLQGSGHSFMPQNAEATDFIRSLSIFIKWIYTASNWGMA